MNTRADANARTPAEAAGAVAPHIIGPLLLASSERDDVTLDQAIDVLANGWKKVRGRTDRQMLIQIAALLAAPAPSHAEQAIDERARFEKWISSSPFEKEINRHPNNDYVSWPGQYKDINVELAWEAYQFALEKKGTQ